MSRQGWDARRDLGGPGRGVWGGDGVPGACQHCCEWALTWLGKKNHEDLKPGLGKSCAISGGSPLGISGR